MKTSKRSTRKDERDISYTKKRGVTDYCLCRLEMGKGKYHDQFEREKIHNIL